MVKVSEINNTIPIPGIYLMCRNRLFKDFESLLSTISGVNPREVTPVNLVYMRDLEYKNRWYFHAIDVDLSEDTLKLDIDY